MEGSGSPHHADCSRFAAYPRLTPTPAVKPLKAAPDPRNDKPPERGLDAAGGLPIRFRCESSVIGNVHGCSSRVKHPTTLAHSVDCSGRGNYAQSQLKPTPGQPACRHAALVGKREWHLRGRTLSKSSRQQGGSVSHQFCTIGLGVFRLCRAEFTISHQGLDLLSRPSST